MNTPDFVLTPIREHGVTAMKLLCARCDWTQVYDHTVSVEVINERTERHACPQFFADPLPTDADEFTEPLTMMIMRDLNQHIS